MSVGKLAHGREFWVLHHREKTLVKVMTYEILKTVCKNNHKGKR
jgi:hypothetical protein